MAKDKSMDISVKFDFQEVKNAVEQAKKEAQNRYDLKDADVQIELSETQIKLTAGTEMQIEAVFGILLKKVIGRNLSPKILDRQPPKPIGGMRTRQEINLVTTLDQENAKKISKTIRENYQKTKPTIQGDTIRVTSPSIDTLQTIIRDLTNDEKINVPLHFGNFK